MKITIEQNEKTSALMKAMASNDPNKSMEALAAAADFVAAPINAAIDNAPTISNLFETMSFTEGDNPSIPLELFHDITDEDYLQVYSQQIAGGLPTNQLFPAHNELKFDTYTLDSAWSFDRKYARRSRLDVLSATFQRMLQEILLKQERNAMNVLATALVKGNSKYGSSSTAAKGNHIIGSTQENRFLLHDLNKLITRSKRINASFSAGTPVGGSKSGVTDLLVSPEIIEKVREMGYNPVNTVDSDGTTASGSDSGQLVTDEVRNQLYGAAGMPSFYGINLMEMLELGVGQRYNSIFGAVVAAESATVAGAGGGSWATSDDEILIGIDRSRRSLIRPTVTEEDSNGAFNIMVDDSFNLRSGKMGYFGRLEEGRISLEDRGLVGLVV